MSNFIGFITSDKFKGVVAICAAVIMYFTPDNIDRIIESFLAAFGISSLMLSKKE